MGIESSFNGIADLDPTLPLGSDQKNKGDDHIRGIKLAITSDFPAITGAVTSSQDELNYLDGATPGTAVASKALVVDASKNLTSLGSVTATAFNGLLTGNVTGNVTGNIVGVVNTGSSIASAVTATTQSAGDNSSKVATTAYVDQLFGTKTFISGQYQLTQGTAFGPVNHGLGGLPDIFTVVAECLEADFPFVAGDYAEVSWDRDVEYNSGTGEYDGAYYGSQAFATATQVSLVNGADGVRFAKKNTGGTHNPNVSKWRLRIKAIKF